MSAARNPVVPGFHPDPSVCRVGDDYFLVTSSFTYFPGVPIFHSKDLIDWRQIGNVLDRPSQLDLRRTEGRTTLLGIFAPTIRHHDGRFYLITTLATADSFRNFLVTTEDPTGPWSDPVPIEVTGIDPDLAWDDEGVCWLHTGALGIYRHRVDPETGSVLAGPEPTWSGTGLQYPEAPHLYQRDGTWYLMIAEGGTERGHAVSIARGPSPDGPWEPCPSNPIITHRSTDRPIQNTGHADLVEAPDGSWWMLLLGTRPRGITPGFHVLGRETFLTSVAWTDGWPVIGALTPDVQAGPSGIPSPRPEPTRDDFDELGLAAPWVSLRAPLDGRGSLTDRPGWLRLHGGPALDDPAPVLVGRRQQHHRCWARTRVSLEGALEAGLTVWMSERAHYDVAVVGDVVVVRATIGPLSQEVAAGDLPGGDTVTLAIRCEGDPLNQEPDLIDLGFLDDRDRFEPVASLPGRYLSTEVAGGFTGRIMAMYAVDGDAAFDWFDYEEIIDL